jgi:hypothetical protein
MAELPPAALETERCTERSKTWHAYGKCPANVQWCNLKLDIFVFATIIRKNFRKIIVT